MEFHAQTQIRLIRPECSGADAFAAATRVPGVKPACSHRGIELTVTHERGTAGGPQIWSVQPPEPDETRTRT